MYYVYLKCTNTLAKSMLIFYIIKNKNYVTYISMDLEIMMTFLLYHKL